MQSKRNSCLHSGHRQRMREKVEKFGLDGLSEHEKLEHLLFYVNQRKDTNETAHMLLNKFGSFYNVLTAEINELKQVKNVGDKTAIFLKTFLQYVEWFNNDKNKHKLKLSNTLMAVRHYRSVVGVSLREEAHVALLNEKEELIKMINVGKGNSYNVEIDEKKLLSEVNSTRPRFVLIFHTHPLGDVRPSEADDKATVNLICSCKMYNTLLVDHIILNDKNYYSYKNEGRISELTLQADKIYSHIIKN